MSECLGCENPTKVTLRTGTVVCNTCEEWRLECEARWALDTLPDRPEKKRTKKLRLTRGQYLEDVKAARGVDQYMRLRSTMLAILSDQKNGRTF